MCPGLLSPHPTLIPQVMKIGQEDGVPLPLEDKLEFVKFSSMAWTHDHKGFFYNRSEGGRGGQA